MFLSCSHWSSNAIEPELLLWAGLLFALSPSMILGSQMLLLDASIVSRLSVPLNARKVSLFKGSGSRLNPEWPKIVSFLAGMPFKEDCFPFYARPSCDLS